MQDKIPNNSINLIYLDPPFNSNRNYNRIYSTNTGLPVPEEAIAFCDAWELTQEKEDDIKEFNETLINDGNQQFADFWSAWVNALRYQNPKILSYLVFMAQRLWVMRAKLKDTGSLFLHCDPTASHYIKIILDGIFGHRNFRNEIVWCYKSGGASKKHFARKHDIIFWYSKSEKYYFNPMKEKSYMGINYSTGNKNVILYDDNDGQGKYTLVYPKDWWNIPIMATSSKDRLGYPTQKPLPLLEKIIKSCTKEADVVLDPFCGCGTTLDAAQNLNRKWIGIDICLLSTTLMEERLKEKYSFLKRGQDYTIDGMPVTMEQVKELISKCEKSKNEGRYQFQYWAVEKVKGFASTKKSGDGGIDGSIYFYKDEKKNLGKMILSVKSDKKLQKSYIRDLVGTLANNKAEMAGLICLDKPTDGMLAEARKAGYYSLDDGLFGKLEYPKVQILTAEEILNGKTFDIPPTQLTKKSS